MTSQNLTDTSCSYLKTNMFADMKFSKKIRNFPFFVRSINFNREQCKRFRNYEKVLRVFNENRIQRFSESMITCSYETIEKFLRSFFIDPSKCILQSFHLLHKITKCCVRQITFFFSEMLFLICLFGWLKRYEERQIQKCHQINRQKR